MATLYSISLLWDCSVQEPDRALPLNVELLEAFPELLERDGFVVIVIDLHHHPDRHRRKLILTHGPANHTERKGFKAHLHADDENATFSR